MKPTLQDVFSTKEEALISVNRWRKSGFTAKIEYDGVSYKVYVGSFGDRYKKLKRLARQIKRQNEKSTRVSERGGEER